MGKYDDIIGLERPDSKRKTRLSMSQRAGQFAPYAALGELEFTSRSEIEGEYETEIFGDDFLQFEDPEA